MISKKDEYHRGAALTTLRDIYQGLSAIDKIIDVTVFTTRVEGEESN